MSNAVRCFLLFMAFGSWQAASAATVTATYDASTDVPVTADGYAATDNNVNFTLNFAPQTGTELMVVRNTGLNFISGTFTNLAHGQTVTLGYAGVNYQFVANYYGGTGNDLVLVWKDTKAWAWGSNVDGQLGNITTTNSSVPVAVLQSSGALVGKTVIATAVGVSHSLALCSDGTLAAWGYNGYGQLGNTTTSSSVPVAVRQSSGVLSGRTVVAIAAGAHHNLALCSDGTLASWGDNANGQLGNNTLTFSNVPVAVLQSSGLLTGKTVVAMAAGAYHNLALCSDGTLAAWGRNSSGQLGNNSTTNNSAPVAVRQSSGLLAGKTVVALAAGYFHSLALCSDGTLAAWGANTSGQLGNNTTTNSSVPVAVLQSSGLLAGKTVVALAAGDSHNLALCSDDTLAAWGSNSYGQFGTTTTTNSSVPVAVSTTALAPGERLTRVVSSAVAGHTLALMAIPIPPPTVATLAATSLTTTEATLNGTVIANTYSTDVSFEYGLTTAYGQTVTATPSTVTGSTLTTVCVTLSGLSPGTTYHFRVKGSNVVGISTGADLTFAPLTIQQAWRQQYFGISSNTGDASDQADPDKDGNSNLLEWACGSNPTEKNTLPLAAGVKEGNFEFTNTRSISAINAGVVFIVE